MTLRSRRYNFSARRSRSGFALIITIILMAFLVLLMVSMAALTRVETQVAANYQQQDQARSNALLALNIALGQLQAAAGPDQRITARADILDDTPTDEAITGVNQPHWTGVWTTGSASPDIANSGDPQRKKTFGNLNPDPARKSASAEWLVSKPTASTVVDPIAGPSGETIMLASQIGSTPTDVKVPRVDLTAVVPGLSGNQVIGRYAYWVDDEGIKARINIKDLTLKTDSTGATQVDAETNIATNQLHFVGPQAIAAHEILPSTLSTDFRQNPKVDQVLTPQQLPFLPANAPTGFVTKTYLPDITTYSYGVLADVRRGGLRKDLTAALEDTGSVQNKNYAKLNPYSSGQTYTQRVYDILTDTIPIATSTTTTNSLRGLLWGDLHRFYNYYKSTQPTVQLANLKPPDNQAQIPTGIGDPASRPYQVSQASFNARELNSNFATGVMSPVCIGVRYDVALKSVPQPLPIGHYKLVLEYHPVSIWYNPYAVRIESRLEDQTVFISPEVDTYLQITVGSDNYFCILNQGDKNGRVALTNSPNDTHSFEPGAIRVFAMNSTRTINPTNDLPYPTGSITKMSSMFQASNFGRAYGQSLPTLVSKKAVLSQCNETEFVAVRDITKLKSGENYTPIGSLPGDTSITLTLNNSKYNKYPNPLVADIARWGMGSWPDTSTSTDWRSNFGVTAGVNGAGAYNTYAASPPTAKRRVDTMTDSALLFSFNMRMKGLKSDPNEPYGNAAFQIPSFMGNSEVFNPISTTFSGCWNEARGPSLAAGSWPTLYDPGVSLMTDVNDYSFSTWGDQSAGIEFAQTGGSYRKVLADIPLQPMVSLGQFTHLQADYFKSFSDYGRLTFGSMFIGGSYPNPGVPLEQNLLDVTDTSKLMLKYKLYSLDNSYLANQALFDSYYFSTAPPKNPQSSPTQWTAFNNANPGLQLTKTTPFLNSRMVPYRKNGVAPLLADLRDMDKAAANLLLLGAFNINSTSISAWRALLSSLSGNDLSMWNASERRHDTFTATQLKSPIPRFWSATGNGNLDSPWCGVRSLDDNQITELATRIVAEVKNRGPFLSLADFLNRRLGANSSDLTRAGALQAAIDKTSPDINSFIKVKGVPVNVTTASTGPDQRPSVNPINSNMQDASGQPWNTTVGMPGYLMQQDLVQAFSPVMAARSDTFVIRTYGEKTDPLTQKTVAKAYCEAVVQRLPDFVDPSDPELTKTQSGYAAPAGDATPVYQPNGVTPIVNPTNEKFGRRFKIVSFRWITPNDL